MQKLIIGSVIALAGVLASGTAIANYVYPGRIIIGYGGFGGGGLPIGGSTTNAAFIEECVLAAPVECECFPGVSVFEACLKSGAKLQCLMPHHEYLDVEQQEPVVFEAGEHQLGALVCTGESNGTAYIRLPLPKG